MRFLYTLILSFASFSTLAQQWVIDEIADEQKTSESIPGWLIVSLLIIGYFVYKHIQKKDDEAAERSTKERRMEEKQRLEEELREYRERHEDDIDISQLDDDIIVPLCHNQGIHDSTIKASQAKTEKQLSNIETDKYILSPDGKEFIKAKDCDILVIPNSVEVIKYQALSGCEINKITIPNSVKTIDTLAFSGCSVEKIIIPNSVEKFGELIFCGCKNLKEVVFVDGLKTFGKNMFERCLSLKTVILPNALISIPDSAFDTCISLSEISLPPTLKRIGDSAFCSCQNLRDISIPLSVNDIGRWAFRNCAISKLVIPDSIYGIPEYSFAENLNLKEVYLPNTITCIMSNAFYGCENLYLRIPPSVTFIAPDAFEQCNDYSYDNLHIEVPKGKKRTLENICEHLKGKVYEYELSDNLTLPPDLTLQKKRFIDFQIFKEKEDLRNSDPVFYYGAQVVFKYNNNCTYDNFDNNVCLNEKADERTGMDFLDSSANTEIPIEYNSLDYSTILVPDGNNLRNREKEHKEFIKRFIKEQEDKFFPIGSIEDKLQSLSHAPLVDLGLSVKWCSKNIGASEIYDLGYQFRWGSLDYIEIYEKEKVTKYFDIPYDDNLDKLDKDISGEISYDAATKYSNGEFRIPTKSECEELIERCNWEYVEVDKYKGFIITGPSGNSIYLPLSYSSFVNCMDIVMMTVEEAYMTSTPDMTPRPKLEQFFGFEGYTYKLKIINSEHKTEKFTQRIDCFSKKDFSPIRGVSRL